MTETFKYPLKRDEKKIDVKESWDLNFWCEELNLRTDELKEIISMVGPAVHDVRLHLAKKLMTNWPATY